MTDRMHWRYFLAIETDLANTARFVEFEPPNMNTYSIEFLRLLLAAGAECDVVLQQISARWGKLPERPNIDNYRSAILSRRQHFPRIQVTVPRYQMSFCPWEAWGDKLPTHPTWWDAYNAAKHRRHYAFSTANLQNALYAVAGLFVAVLALHVLDGTADELSDQLPVLLEVEHSPGYRITSGYGLPEVSPAEPSSGPQ